MTPLATTLANTSARGEGLFNLRGKAQPQFIYVINQGDNSVSKISLATFTVTATLSLTYTDPRFIIIDPLGTYAYVGLYNSGSGYVAQINLSTFTVSNYVSGFGWPLSGVIDPTGTYLYTVDGGNSSANKTTLASFTSGPTANTGSVLAGTGTAIAVDKTGTYVYVGGQTGTGQFSKVNASSWTLTSSYNTNSPIYSITIDNNSTYAYVGTNGGFINQINLSTFTYSGGYSLPSNYAWWSGIDPTNTYLYASALLSSGNIFKIPIPAASSSTSVTITGSPFLRGGAIDPLGTFLYICDQSSNSLWKINLTTFTIVGSVSVGTTPYNCAISYTNSPS